MKGTQVTRSKDKPTDMDADNRVEKLKEEAMYIHKGINK
jgi:hypothetical protein